MQYGGSPTYYGLAMAQAMVLIVSAMSAVNVFCSHECWHTSVELKKVHSGECRQFNGIRRKHIKETKHIRTKCNCNFVCHAFGKFLTSFTKIYPAVKYIRSVF